MTTATKKIEHEFSYGYHVQLLNGQRLSEFPTGLEGNWRPFRQSDREDFPQAENDLDETEVLVIDRDNRQAYAVSAKEAAEIGLV